MNWHELVFSDRPALRARRHLLFWLVWWVYLATTYYYYLQAGLQKIAFGSLTTILALKTLLLIIILAASCYFFIYVLLPRFVFTKKYFGLLAGIVLLTVFLVGAGYLIHGLVFPLIDSTYRYTITTGNATLWWTNINSGLLNAPKVIAAATAVKLVKRWYLKQKEKERIEKEKLITDLQLMKAQIRPAFLFNSLDQIYQAALSNSPQAPVLLLRLADLLSYLLYECDEAKVPLEKDLNMMKEYMFLEKARYGGSLDLETVIRGDIPGKRIAPLLLLPFIEDSFKHCSHQEEQPWINLDISVENDTLSMKLINGITINGDSPRVPAGDTANIDKRLQLLYAGNYELKRYIENEIYVVSLKVNLRERSQPDSIIAKIVDGQTLNKDYAFN